MPWKVGWRSVPRAQLKNWKIFRTRNLPREFYGQFRWVKFNDQYLENYTSDFFQTKFIRAPIQCRKYVTAFLYNNINFQFFSNFSPIQGITSPIWHRYIHYVIRDVWNTIKLRAVMLMFASCILLQLACHMGAGSQAQSPVTSIARSART